jgi:putative hydrolase of the HAD superfamily
MIQAIIFDFGRVISAQKPMALFQSYERELGLAPNTINQIMFGSEAWEDTLLGRKTTQEFWHAIGPQLNLHTPEEIDQFHLRYHADEAINKDVIALIRRLHAIGKYKLAVLSNAPAGLSRWLDEWNIYDLFDVIFCSGDEGVKKPDPEAFKITLERLMVTPREAIFIDDTLSHVQAARALGLYGIQFSNAAMLTRELDTLLET